MLIYDGECGFCIASARWIEQRGALVEPWQALDLGDYPITQAEASEAAWWIDQSGIAHRGHAAIAHALKSTSGGWRIIGILLLRPPVSWLARPVYSLVSRIRHRLPSSC